MCVRWKGVEVDKPFENECFFLDECVSFCFCPTKAVNTVHFLSHSLSLYLFKTYQDPNSKKPLDDII